MATGDVIKVRAMDIACIWCTAWWEVLWSAVIVVDMAVMKLTHKLMHIQCTSAGVHMKKVGGKAKLHGSV